MQDDTPDPKASEGSAEENWDAPRIVADVVPPEETPDISDLTTPGKTTGPSRPRETWARKHPRFKVEEVGDGENTAPDSEEEVSWASRHRPRSAARITEIDPFPAERGVAFMFTSMIASLRKSMSGKDYDIVPSDMYRIISYALRAAQKVLPDLGTEDETQTIDEHIRQIIEEALKRRNTLIPSRGSPAINRPHTPAVTTPDMVDDAVASLGPALRELIENSNTTPRILEVLSRTAAGLSNSGTLGPTLNEAKRTTPMRYTGHHPPGIQ